MIKYWRANPVVEQYVARLASGTVVDIGANRSHRFAPARFSVGWEGDWRMDLDRDPLPEECENAFVYSRHTLEDLAYPEHLLREIRHRASGGYIETPSPFAELTRGVDSDPCEHRGYRHHRWVLWSDGATLHLVPKYPVVEQLPHFDFTEQLADPKFWNTHHAWEGELSFKVWRHEKEFNLAVSAAGCPSIEYAELLSFACDQAHTQTRDFWERMT